MDGYDEEREYFAPKSEAGMARRVKKVEQGKDIMFLKCKVPCSFMFFLPFHFPRLCYDT